MTLEVFIPDSVGYDWTKSALSIKEFSKDAGTWMKLGFYFADSFTELPMWYRLS